MNYAPPLTRTRGRVIRQDRITLETVRENPNTSYCFECTVYGPDTIAVVRLRQEPNTIWVLTKWRASKASNSYFNNSVIHNPVVWESIHRAFQNMRSALAAGRNVVIPEHGFGRGRAQLKTKAPTLYAMIEAAIDGLTGESQ